MASLFRVLLVNGHPPSQRGRRRFRAFSRLVSTAFLRLNGTNKANVTFLEANLTSISDYVFDPEKPGFPDVKAPRRFDSLDFIFVDADERMLPWHPRCRNLVLLMRMALKTRKFLFARGSAMRLLGYVCHTRWAPMVDIVPAMDPALRKPTQQQASGTSLRLPADKEVEVDGRWDERPDPHQYHYGSGGGGGRTSIELVTLLARDTGDVYHFRRAPMPVGLGEVTAVNAEALEALHSVRPAMFVAEVNYGIREVTACEVSHRPRQGTLLEKPLPMFEQQIRPCPEALKHYLFKGMVGQDICAAKGRHRWALFPRNSSEQQRGYVVLAETDSEPQIIQSEFCVGVQFALDAAHPHTVSLLNNYVERHVGLLLERGRITYLLTDDMSVLMDPQHKPTYMPLFRTDGDAAYGSNLMLAASAASGRVHTDPQAFQDDHVQVQEFRKAAARMGLTPEGLRSLTPGQWHWVLQHFSKYTEEQILRLKRPLRVPPPQRAPLPQSTNVDSRASMITASAATVGLFAWPNYNKRSVTPMVLSTIPGVRATLKSLSHIHVSRQKLARLQKTGNAMHATAGHLAATSTGRGSTSLRHTRSRAGLPSATAVRLQNSQRFSSQRLSQQKNSWSVPVLPRPSHEQAAREQTRELAQSLALPPRAWAIRSMLATATRSDAYQADDFVHTLEQKYPSLGSDSMAAQHNRAIQGMSSGGTFRNASWEQQMQQQQQQIRLQSQVAMGEAPTSKSGIRRFLHGDRQERAASKAAGSGAGSAGSKSLRSSNVASSSSRRSLMLSRSRSRGFSTTRANMTRRQLRKPYVSHYDYTLANTKGRLLDWYSPPKTTKWTHDWD